MGRNDLHGSAGDAMNAILAAAGHNLRIIQSVEDGHKIAANER
jgi:hypothetical protein